MAVVNWVAYWVVTLLCVAVALSFSAVILAALTYRHLRQKGKL